MIELPEALTLAGQLRGAVAGKTVTRVLPPTKAHKFCWFSGDPADYHGQLAGRSLEGAEGFGIFCELAFSGGRRLCVNDGVNARLVSAASLPRDYQLVIEFSDGAALAFTVAMYGGIVLHSGDYDNEYYQKSLSAISPFSPQFAEYYHSLLAQSKPNLSLKALLATGQRFPGLGNGVLQDILFCAHVHPRRKLGTLDAPERENLLGCTVSVLRQMTELGGRDTEKDLFGNPGGYKTQMSKNSISSGCPVCGGPVTKEAYLGGSVYYCPGCQPHIN